MAHLILKTVRKAPPDVAEIYMKMYDADANHAPDDMEEVYNERLRLKLDAGLGAELFQNYRARLASKTSPVEITIGDRTKISIIVLAALMMRYGAKIEAHHAQLYVVLSRSFEHTYCASALPE